MVGKPVFSRGPEFKSYDRILVTQPLTCNMGVVPCLVQSITLAGTMPGQGSR